MDMEDYHPNGSGSHQGNYSLEQIADLRHSPLLTIFYCLAYFTVFLVGVLGNSFVVAVVYHSPRMKTVTYFFIVNLAMADMIIIFCLPATLIGNIFTPWVLGWFACKTVPYLQGVSVSASINTLVAISMDRFLAICYPMRWQITTRVCRIIILVIWLFSFLITLPWAIYFKLSPMYPEDDPTNPDLQMCQEVWPSEYSDALYFLVANLTLCYLLPLALICVCYGLIWIKVWTRKLPGETRDHGMDEMIQKSKIKVVKMLMTVVIMFALSWLPLYATFSVVKCSEPLWGVRLNNEVVSVAIPVAQWLGASNSCINPILYAFFNKKFRTGFQLLLTGNKCCGPLHYDYSFTYKTSTFRSTSTCASRISKTSVQDRRSTVALCNNVTAV